MAASSNKLLLLLLFTVVTALVVSATAETGCEPDRAFPHDQLQGCRAYVLRRCAGDDPPGMRARCCHQLEEVTPLCRCDALRIMVDVLVEEEAAPPSCRKAAMVDIAAALPAQDECDLEAPPAPFGGDCPLQAATE